jgi:hypothetical protein
MVGNVLDLVPSLFRKTPLSECIDETQSYGIHTGSYKCIMIVLIYCNGLEEPCFAYDYADVNIAQMPMALPNTICAVVLLVCYYALFGWID